MKEITPENKGKFKDLIIQDLSYYERRFEVVCLVVIGFVMYGVLEVGKLFIKKDLKLSTFLFSVIIIAAFLVIICLANLMTQRAIKENHLSLILEEFDAQEKEIARVKSEKLERNMLLMRKIILTGIIICFVLLIISLHNILY